MSGQWINAAKVVKLLAKEELSDDAIKKVVATLAGRSIVGVVKQCRTVISLFHYAITNSSAPAWELLCMLYRHTAFAQAHTVLEADEADDVAQDVVMQLWIKRARLSPDTNLGGWVRVMAKNRSIDVMRSRRAYAEAVGEEGTEDDPAEYIWPDPDEQEIEAHELQSNIDWDTPEAMACADEMIERIAAASDEMTPLTRKVMVFVDRGMTYEEIAEELGCTEETVRQTVSRAERYLLEAATYNNKV